VERYWHSTLTHLYFNSVAWLFCEWRNINLFTPRLQLRFVTVAFARRLSQVHLLHVASYKKWQSHASSAFINSVSQLRILNMQPDPSIFLAVFHCCLFYFFFCRPSFLFFFFFLFFFLFVMHLFLHISMYKMPLWIFSTVSRTAPNFVDSETFRFTRLTFWNCLQQQQQQTRQNWRIEK